MNRHPRNAAELEAVKEYARSHGGLDGNARIAIGDAADPRDVSTMLGWLHSIVYVTAKGDREVAEWEHAFSGRNPPALTYSREGRLLIIGGGYRVEHRGIVG